LWWRRSQRQACCDGDDDPAGRQVRTAIDGFGSLPVLALIELFSQTKFFGSQDPVMSDLASWVVIQ